MYTCNLNYCRWYNSIVPFPLRKINTVLWRGQRIHCMYEIAALLDALYV